MSDDPLAVTSWDVKRLYSEGYEDRAERLARYLRGRESGEPSEATPGAAWVRCPHCGSDDVDVELRGGQAVAFVCVRCTETGTVGSAGD